MRFGAGPGFNPRAHAGRDELASAKYSAIVWFQSARPRGARQSDRAGVDGRRVVSIRAPTRGATVAGVIAHCGASVSIRAPTRGATRRERRLGLRHLVSIRAPTRGATAQNAYRIMMHQFQSARPRGARPAGAGRRHAHASGFNPRAHAGRDTCRRRRCRRHASFNPRAHAGRDVTVKPLRSTRTQFQSARPRGARRRMRTGGRLSRPSFNPRAHAGRDLGNALVVVVGEVVSIRAPTRGATVTSCTGTPASGEFQSARPRGARPGLPDGEHELYAVSIRAPTRGATIQARTKAWPFDVSIRAPTRGATNEELRLGWCDEVSIRAPTRGATLRATPRVEARPLFQSARPRGARLHPPLLNVDPF